MRQTIRSTTTLHKVTPRLLGAGIFAALLACTGPSAKQTETETQPTPATATETEPETPTASLAGTSWRLIEFQSMDDAIDTLRPEDPGLFTMRLDGDGTVNLRLDCNRAQGTWSSEPAGDGTSGGFEFGPLAATKALCPPPRLGDRLTADAQWVRGYLLRDGNLYLSLMADGGIYAWEPDPNSPSAASDTTTPAEIPFETKADPTLEAAILRASPDYTAETVHLSNHPARYLYSRFDLDQDGSEEVFVYLLGPIFCGSGGCNLLLFTESEAGYDLLQTFPISRLPVIVSPQTANGWNNLIRPESGGGAPATYVNHTFDGQTYVESQRISADTEPKGTRILAGEFSFTDGIPLLPREN